MNERNRRYDAAHKNMHKHQHKHNAHLSHFGPSSDRDEKATFNNHGRREARHGVRQRCNRDKKLGLRRRCTAKDSQAEEAAGQGPAQGASGRK
eukprot:13572097-Heterocapsa_arctica.AAC.1